MPVEKKDRSVIFGFYYHLPVGVSDSIFEKIYVTKLKPFFQILYEYPKIPFALHLSGTLLYKIERIHGEFFMLISDMVKRKQVELLGGGFYEPMMPYLLHVDRIGQIELMTTYLRKHFGKRVYGCWIPNTAWEQSVTSAIAGSGLRYTFIDEKKFIEAGLSEEQYNFPCVSEDKGKTITVFPVFSSLKEKFLENGIFTTIDTLLSQRKNKKFVRMIVPDFFNQDKNKETYINNFFEDISKYENDINFSLPDKEQKNQENFQKIYFPQMANKKYLIDYPEAGLLYSKITRTKLLIEQLKGDKERKRSAQEDLWKAQGFNLFCYDDQCENSVKNETHYPGIYNAGLRNMIYRAVLEAERTTRDKSGWMPSLTVYDFDFDGVDEYLFQGKFMNCFVRKRGAVLFELDYIPIAWNYQNTITFPDSDYHNTESTFFDIIAPPEYDVCKTGYSDGLRVLGTEIFEETGIERIHQTAAFYSPPCEGAFGCIEIKKDFKLNGNIILTHYKLTNTGNDLLKFKFITKINLSFSSDSDNILRIFAYSSYKSFSNNGEKTAIPNNQTSILGVEAIDFQDLRNELIINISSDSNFDANLFCVKAKYRDPLGEINDQYQWTKILAQKNCVLKSGESTEFVFRLGIFH